MNLESGQTEPFSAGPVRRGVAWRVVEDRRTMGVTQAFALPCSCHEGREGLALEKE